MVSWEMVGTGPQGLGESLLLRNTSLILSLTTTLVDRSYQRGVCVLTIVVNYCMLYTAGS